jgi:hypothetical protein
VGLQVFSRLVDKMDKSELVKVLKDLWATEATAEAVKEKK